MLSVVWRLSQLWLNHSGAQPFSRNVLDLLVSKGHPKERAKLMRAYICEFFVFAAGASLCKHWNGHQHLQLHHLNYHQH